VAGGRAVVGDRGGDRRIGGGVRPVQGRADAAGEPEQHDGDRDRNADDDAEHVEEVIVSPARARGCPALPGGSRR
jgi:hypothetical protein